MDRLARQEYYYFLDGYLGYNQIAIDLQYQEKTAFTWPYKTFAFRRMTFGLLNVHAIVQRYMMTMFLDMIQYEMEVFMDDFLFVGITYDECCKPYNESYNDVRNPI